MPGLSRHLISCCFFGGTRNAGIYVEGVQEEVEERVVLAEEEEEEEEEELLRAEVALLHLQRES